MRAETHEKKVLSLGYVICLFERRFFQGFARYSTDDKWHVPHFEKMLYDQGQLAVAYSEAFLATKDPFFEEVVRDILTYVSRDLSHEVSYNFVAWSEAMCRLTDIVEYKLRVPILMNRQ